VDIFGDTFVRPLGDLWFAACPSGLHWRRPPLRDRKSMTPAVSRCNTLPPSRDPVSNAATPAGRDSSAVRLVLLGAPGSGKGTQGALLADYFDIPRVSSGELLRAHVAADSELGRRVQTFLAHGDLVPDDLVVDVVRDAIASAGNPDGYLLDGFPRTLAQARRAFDLAAPTGATADAVIYLDVPDDVARTRLARRAQTDRDDDADPAAIERRLEIFHAETIPLLKFYEQRGILVTVDAEEPVDLVTTAILEALAER
jgi:adenylate kinase